MTDTDRLVSDEEAKTIIDHLSIYDIRYGTADVDWIERLLATRTALKEAAEEFVTFYDGPRNTQLGNGQAQRSFVRMKSLLASLSRGDEPDG